MARDRLSFEWDNRKNLANKRKHKVSFEEAQTVFYDEEALLRDDPDGVSSALRALVVCHCYRSADQIIRIISARKATRSEAREYERNLAR